MATKQEAAQAAIQQARDLLDQAETALVKAEEFLDEQEALGTEVDRSDWFSGDVFGVVRDHINAVQTTVEQA